MLLRPRRNTMHPPYTADVCFDNFFYSGAQLTQTVQFLSGADACEVFDLPGAILQGPQAFQFGAIWMHYVSQPRRQVGGVGVAKFLLKTLWARGAPGLAGALPLTSTDALTGARFLSDHLPTVLEAHLP
jgi:hypothetical protein